MSLCVERRTSRCVSMVFNHYTPGGAVINIKPLWWPASTWTESNVSAYVPADAVGVLIRVVNAAAGTGNSNILNVRKKGSTDGASAAYGLVGFNGVTAHVSVGIDANKKFELYSTAANPGTSFNVYLVGYWTSGFVWLTNAQPLTLSGEKVWQTLDLTSYLGADAGNVAAVFIKIGTANADGKDRIFGLRKYGTVEGVIYTANRLGRTVSMMVQPDSLDQIQFYRDIGNMTCSLMGYVILGVGLLPYSSSWGLTKSGFWRTETYAYSGYYWWGAFISINNVVDNAAQAGLRASWTTFSPWRPDGWGQFPVDMSQAQNFSYLAEAASEFGTAYIKFWFYQLPQSKTVPSSSRVGSKTGAPSKTIGALSKNVPSTARVGSKTSAPTKTLGALSQSLPTTSRVGSEAGAPSTTLGGLSQAVPATPTVALAVPGASSWTLGALSFAAPDSAPVASLATDAAGSGSGVLSYDAPDSATVGASTGDVGVTGELSHDMPESARIASLPGGDAAGEPGAASVDMPSSGTVAVATEDAGMTGELSHELPESAVVASTTGDALGAGTGTAQQEVPASAVVASGAGNAAGSGTGDVQQEAESAVVGVSTSDGSGSGEGAVSFELPSAAALGVAAAEATASLGALVVSLPLSPLVGVRAPDGLSYLWLGARHEFIEVYDVRISTAILVDEAMEELLVTDVALMPARVDDGDLSEAVASGGDARVSSAVDGEVQVPLGEECDVAASQADSEQVLENDALGGLAAASTGNENIDTPDSVTNEEAETATGEDGTMRPRHDGE